MKVEFEDRVVRPCSITTKTSKFSKLAQCDICGVQNVDGRHRSCVECGMMLCYNCKQKKFEKIAEGQYTCGDRRHARRKKERDFALGFEGVEFEIDPEMVRSFGLASPTSRLSLSMSKASILQNFEAIVHTKKDKTNCSISRLTAFAK